MKKTLKDFNYAFNVKGEMKKIGENGDITDIGFKFDEYEERAKNQERYEQIGGIIDQEVYRLLQTEAGLEKVEIGDGEVKSFVFCSGNVMRAEKVVMMIHGSGVVRAGQWARRLIINNNLDCGTMLPYIKHIQSQGWGVIILNTNHNIDLDTGDRIPGSERPEQHAVTVWQQLVTQAAADQLAIIAHSYGGVVTMAMAGHPDIAPVFMDKVVGVFLTDSVHYGLSGNKMLDKKLVKLGKNYVTSDKPLGILLTETNIDLPLYSSGAQQHEWTSYSCQEEIFKDLGRVFIENKPVTGTDDMDIDSNERKVTKDKSDL